jgi:methyl-accepting chemotaxis protein
MYRTLWKSPPTISSTDPEIIQCVRDVFEGKNESRIADPKNFSETHYYFIDIHDESTVSGNMLDMVARIEYDTTFLEQHLSAIRIFHILVALIAAILGLFIAYLLAYHISRPVQRIIDDINRIAVVI